jgi:hypothetical protein
MITRKFNKKELMFALVEEIRGPDDECPNVVYVESSEWINEGKYIYRDVIFRGLDDNKFWCYGESRSGSYFSDYWYSWDTEGNEVVLTQVEKVEKVIEVWESVQDA